MGWSISPKTKASINEENGNAVFQENESQNDSAYTITYSDCYQTGSTTITVKHCQQCASAFTCYRADSIGDTGATFLVEHVDENYIIHGKTQEYIITGTSKDCSGIYKAPIVTISEDFWKYTISNTGANYTVRVYHDDVYASPYLAGGDPYEDNNTKAIVTVKNPMSNTACQTFEVYFNKLEASLMVSRKPIIGEDLPKYDAEAYRYRAYLRVYSLDGYGFEVPFKEKVIVSMTTSAVTELKYDAVLYETFSPYNNCPCSPTSLDLNDDDLCPSIEFEATDISGETYLTAYFFVDEDKSIVDAKYTPFIINCVVPETSHNTGCGAIRGHISIEAVNESDCVTIKNKHGYVITETDDYIIDTNITGENISNN